MVEVPTTAVAIVAVPTIVVPIVAVDETTADMPIKAAVALNEVLSSKTFQSKHVYTVLMSGCPHSSTMVVSPPTLANEDSTYRPATWRNSRA